MAFLEQLGKKLSDAGQGVARQTKDFAEISRLNNIIADDEDRLTRLYTAIGKAYYDTHVYDIAAEQRQTLDEITALLADIAAKQREIQIIKGVATCPNCGSAIAGDTTFCTVCGSKVLGTGGGNVCTKCGATVPAGDRFCSICGTPVENTLDVPDVFEVPDTFHTPNTP